MSDGFSQIGDVVHVVAAGAAAVETVGLGIGVIAGVKVVVAAQAAGVFLGNGNGGHQCVVSASLDRVAEVVDVGEGARNRRHQ